MPPPPLLQRSIYQHGWPALSVGQRGGRGEWLSVAEPPSSCHLAPQFHPGSYATLEGELMRISPSLSVLFPHPNISPHISPSKQRDPHLPSCFSCPNLQGIPSLLHNHLLGWHILATCSHLELFTYTARVHIPCHRQIGTTIVLKLKGFISVPLALRNGTEKIMMFSTGQGSAG